MSRYYAERFPLPLPGRLRRELRLRRPPWWLLLFVVLLILFGAVPLTLILQSRSRLSDKPRVHFIQDMDVQPRYGPQATNIAFGDGRAMRLPPEGTIARGPSGATLLESGYLIDDKQQFRFATALPEELRNDPRLLARGRERFAIYCVTCHADIGNGQGPVHQRAAANKEGKWVPPSDLLSDSVRKREDGFIYNAIRNGVRSMPPHGTQVGTRDRWAIVAWVRELQRTHPAPATQDAATTQPLRAQATR